MFAIKERIGHKRCRKCCTLKPLAEFYKDPKGRLGRRSSCKDCTKKREKKKYYQKRKSEGVNWIEVSKALSLSPEEKFELLYGGSTVRVKGKLVMKKGKVIDEKWYQKKLNRLKKT